MRTRLLPLLLLTLLLPAEAREQRFSATEHQSEWEVTTSRLQCGLSHTIPSFGVATFSQRAGGSLHFTLRLRRRPLQQGEMVMVAMPPSWKHDESPRELGQIGYDRHGTTLHAGETMARRLLLELGNGMFPTLSSPDWVDRRDQMSVALSAVRFQDKLDSFLDCLDGVLPYDFDHVRSTRLHFEFGKSALTRRARARLDDVAAYLVADPAVEQVRVVGHTDSKGRRAYNQALGERRAREVERYLVSKGVSKRLFRLASHGERRPIASNRSSKGRALNRRVTINLAM